MPVVGDFIKKIRERAVGMKLADTLNPAQQIIKIVNEELTEVLLGSDNKEIIKFQNPNHYHHDGRLQGAGKTTLQVNPANKLKKKRMLVL